jgi:hypothetical protein
MDFLPLAYQKGTGLLFGPVLFVTVSLLDIYSYFIVIAVISLAKLQVVSRRFPTAAARVRAQVSLCGICGGQVALEQVFSQYFGFPANSDPTYCSTFIVYHPGLQQ